MILAHPLKKLIGHGITATINSDDPSYFGGYVNANFTACAAALHLTQADVVQLARNSFTAAFLPAEEKRRYLGLVEDYVASVAG